MIKNKTFNGAGLRKYWWYVYVQIRYFIFRMTSTEILFCEGCTFKSFYVNYWETKIFWLAEFIWECLSAHEEQKIKYGITCLEEKNQ